MDEAFHNLISHSYFLYQLHEELHLEVPKLGTVLNEIQLFGEAIYFLNISF